MGVTPSQARPRDTIRRLSALADLTVTSLLTAWSGRGLVAGGGVLSSLAFFNPALFSFFLV